MWLGRSSSISYTYKRTWRQDAIAFWPYRFTDIEESTHRVEAHCHLLLHEAEDVFLIDECPNDVDEDNWNSI